jgi:hypothetical protein
MLNQLLSFYVKVYRFIQSRTENCFEGLKDGLQEVPKGNKWSRRHFSLGNACLHLKGISRHQAMHIGYKTPLPTLAHGITSFRVPLHSPICSLSLLFSPTKFSTNKIFLTAAVRVCLCFSFSEQVQEP